MWKRYKRSLGGGRVMGTVQGYKKPRPEPLSVNLQNRVVPELLQELKLIFERMVWGNNYPNLVAVGLAQTLQYL